MKSFITIFFLLTTAVFCSAQNSLPAELHFNHLSVKDGLPEGFVNSMIQDRQGFIWMTTQRGLVRYDGYKPKIYALGITDPYRMNVYTIFQDRKGRIWAGTAFEGLFLYDQDKDRFIHYPLNSALYDKKSPYMIWGIEDDNLGRLWISTLSPINFECRMILFDPQSETFSRYGKQEKGKNYVDADFFLKVYQDSKGHIWMGSSNGIYEYNNKNKSFTAHLATADSARQKEFLTITEDASKPGILWFTNAMSIAFNGQMNIVNNKGLWRFNSGNDTAKAFYHNPQDPASIANDTIFKVFNDSKKTLWIGTKSGLSIFDREKNNFINYYPGEKTNTYDNSVIDILEDETGNFWCQSVKGILYFNTQTRKFTSITANPKETDGLLSNALNHTFLLDKSGKLWFGAEMNGVQWINRQRSGFIQYGNNPGAMHYFPGGAANGFAKSADGSIWICAQHGLYRWQPQTDSFTQIKFWKGNAVNQYAKAPMVDHNGKVWFYGYNNGDYGLDCYDPITGKTQYYRNIKNDSTSLSSNDVHDIYEDHLKNIWISTYGAGVCQLDQQTQKFIRYPFILNDNFNAQNNGALDDDQVSSIYEDKGGILWVGTNNGGLNRFNRETGTFTSYINALPGFQCVLSIYQNSQNSLWVGTYFGGFFRFNTETGKPEKFTEKNGLLYDGANNILEDSTHNLWLTSSRGISIFNPQTGKVRTLTSANGLPAGNIYFAIKISNREFLFNSDNGFFVVNPEDFVPDPNSPVVHIESVAFTIPGSNPTKDSSIFAFGKKDIRLSYNENRLSFDYVGLYYQQADMVKYAYKLEGYDKEWINAGAVRTVTYTNLSPGTYTFRVKAANSGGVWSTENPSLTITILPPWWKTWWAYLLYAIIFIIALSTFIAYRSAALKRENKVLEDKVNLRTSQLQTSITDLKSTQSKLIQSEKMASLGELTAGIAHEIQNPLNFVNNFSEVNNELIDEIRNQKSKLSREEEGEILNDIFQNNEKINHHGKRADAIVKGMLQHSRSSIGIKEPTDINAMCDEYVRLSYHGLRSKDKSFNATIKTNFDNSIGKINIIPQDIGRVILNLLNNAFYATNERKKQGPQTPGGGTGTSINEAYEPTVTVTTRRLSPPSGSWGAEITVTDNGNGIPQNILEKIFQPFFTTKPTGQGTGLGLSLSFDIVKAHGGEIKVESLSAEAGAQAGTTFIIQIPAI